MGANVNALATLTAADVVIDNEALSRIIAAESDIEDYQKHLELSVSDHTDAAGIAEAAAALKAVKRTRIDLDKDRKTLKAPGLAFCTKLDAGVKRITEQITPIESHLQALVDIPKAHEAEQKAAAEAERKRIIDDRNRALAELGVVLPIATIEAMTDSDYSQAIMQAEDAAKERKAAEEKARKEEEERAAEQERQRLELEKQQEAIRKQQEEIAAQQRAAQAKLDEQQAAIDAENARIAEAKRQAEKAKAAEEKRIEEERIAAEKAEAERLEQERLKAERLEAYSAEVKRLKALEPITEQLCICANTLHCDIPESLKEYHVAICKIVETAANNIRLLATKGDQ